MFADANYLQCLGDELKATFAPLTIVLKLMLRCHKKLLGNGREILEEALKSDYARGLIPKNEIVPDCCGSIVSEKFHRCMA